MAKGTPVEKIYSIKTTGFDPTMNQFGQLLDIFKKLTKAKIELNKVMATTSDVKQYEDASRKLTAVQQKEAEIATKSVGAYYELSKAYKAAKTDLENLAAEHGLESKEAELAAQKLSSLKEQLLAIQNLVKNAGKASANTATGAPLPGLSQEQLQTAQATGAAISELERKEAEAANAATAWVNSQVLGKEAVAELGEEVERVKIPLEEYTGTLEANIKQNIQYKTRLQEIGSELRLLSKSTSAADKNTNDYRNRVAALTKEEKELKIASGELTQTINAQVKYIQAADSSYDRLNAELGLSRNLLRQLSEEEKKSPWAIQLAKDVDKLDKSLKTIDASMGNHQRKVGDYASGYSGLTNSVQQILREAPSAANSLNTFFLAISNNLPIFFDEIKRANAAMETAKKLAQEQAVIAKEQAIAQALAAGATREVAAAEGALAEKTVLANAAASKGPSVFRQVISSVFSLQSGLLLLVFLLTMFGSQVFASVGKLFTLKKSLDDTKLSQDKTKLSTEELRKSYENLNKALESTEYTSAISKLTELRENIKLAKDGFLDKKKVVDQYNESIGKTTGQVKSLDEAEKEMVRNGDAYVKMILYKTAAEITRGEAAKKLVAAQIEYQKNVDIAKDVNRKGEAGKDKATGADGLSEFLSSGLKNETEAAKRDADKAVESLEKIAADFQKKAAVIAKNNGFNFFDPENTKTKTKTYGGAKLTGQQRDALKDIDALRDTLLARNEANFIKGTADEETYLLNIYAINESAYKKKLNLIKGANAEERKVIAEVQRDRVKSEHETADKIYALRQAALQKSLETEVTLLQNKNKLVQEDPVATASAKAESQLETDKAILSLQLQFKRDVDALEKELGKQSLKNIKDNGAAIIAAREKVLKDEKELLAASIKTIEQLELETFAKTREAISQKRLAIANSNSSKGNKTASLEALDKFEQIAQLTSETKALEQQLEKYKEQLRLKQITEDEYAKHYDEYVKKVVALQNILGNSIDESTIKGKLSSKLSKLLNFDIGKDDSAEVIKKKIALQHLLADTITQTFSIAEEAMSHYFDSERAQIEQENDFTQKRLDLELKQRKDRAQSRAEEESLDKQFAARKEAANREAFEKNKKIQIAQARINLATQLSNLAVIAFAPNPLNIATLGTAGAIMYAIQAALALAGYALNVSRINSAKYEYGGAVPSRGGKFGGNSHSRGGTPFTHKGNSFEAEVDELAIVRTKNAPANTIFNLIGTQQQIASKLNKIGGGIDFAPGGRYSKLARGGYIGDGLQAPVFIPSGNAFIINNENLELIEEIKNFKDVVVKLQVETSKRIDRIEVKQVTSTVTSAQKKEVKQSAIGTL